MTSALQFGLLAFSSLIATSDGSSSTTPRPLTAIMVLAVPRSIAIESVTSFLSEEIFNIKKGMPRV